MPRIELIDVAPPGVSAGAEAFVLRDTNTIYLITSSPVFQQARQVTYQCGYSDAMRKLASILAHEEWHVRHGPDEKSAYERQLITLHQTWRRAGDGGLSKRADGDDHGARCPQAGEARPRIGESLTPV